LTCVCSCVCCVCVCCVCVYMMCASITDVSSGIT
jgi:hypothetical protein